MKFIIRDDDLNYFSSPADIERWYADLFGQGIPVGFSAIPFVKPTSDVHPQGTPPGEGEYPISRNQELASYVQEHPLISVLQHGTTHETVRKGGRRVFEYARAVPLQETRRGREELERAFGTTVSIFVPPHDWIGESGIYSVEAAGMDIIRGRGAGLRNWIPRWRYFILFLRMLAYRLAHIFDSNVPAYPYVIDFGRHKELCSYRLEDTDVFDGLEYARRKDGIFVVVVHLHYFTEEKKARLEQLIARGRELGAEFAAPRAVFSAA